MQSQRWIKSVNLSRNQTQLTYFASLSLKAGKLNLFHKKTRFLNYRDGKIRAKCSPQSRLRETAQQLIVAAGLRGKNKQSRGFDHAQQHVYPQPQSVRSRSILNSLLYTKLGKNNCASVRALVKQCYQSRSRLPTCFDMVHPSRKKRKGWMKNWTLFTLLFNIQKYHVNTVQLTRSPNELDMHASPTI